jgi:hypothetical protein
MPDTKITNLTSALASSGDELVVNTTGLLDRKVRAESVANLANNLGPATIAGISVSTSSVVPSTNDGVALGTSALKFSDLYLAAGGVVQFSTDPVNITAGTSALTIAASSITQTGNQHTISAATADIVSARFTTSAIVPTTNDGVALGSSALKFSDLYLASGGVVNFSTGEQGGSGARIVHASSQLAIEASTVLVAGSVRFTTGVIQPTSNDGVALGSSALKFSDLYLASGGVIDFSTGNATITHSAGTLTFASSVVAVSGDLTVSSDASITGATTIGGVLTLTTGNIVFPGTQIGNAGANVLDDYEEGTFTPTFTPGTTGSFTIGYNAATTGVYTKIGNWAHVQGFVQVTTFTSGTGSGNMGLTSLPFNASGARDSLLTLTDCTAGYRGAKMAVFTTGANVTRLRIYANTTGATSTLTIGDCTTGANSFSFTGTYQTS